MSEHRQDLKPYVEPSSNMPEFTVQAVILGLVLSVLFNAANAYLGLKIGMTISASIPSAIISMAALRIFLPKITGRTGTILENNIVHAFASTGESLAAAIIFTVPALIFLGEKITNSNVFFLGMIGGLLGLLMMIPLRQSLMVKEHKNLPFPEGSACAKVLIAGDKGGGPAKPVFLGMLTAGVFKFLMSGFQMFKDTLMWSFPRLHQAGFGYEISPLFLGVGYLVGIRIAAMMFAGGMFGYWVLIPLIHAFAGHNIIFPGAIPIDEMSTNDLRLNYVRYIGAGGVAFGGLISVIRSIPDIFGSIRHGILALKCAPSKSSGQVQVCAHVKDLEHSSIIFGGALLGFLVGGFAWDITWHIGPETWPSALRFTAALIARFVIAGGLGAVILGGFFWLVSRYSSKLSSKFLRTEHDIPLPIVGAVVLAMFLMLWLMPLFDLSFIEASLIIVFCLFFVAVSARMVGLIGTTNQPVSGMTITALLSLTLILMALGHSSQTAKIAAIMGGAVICIAISLSGDLSQDLKTAALVGATPWKVQLAQISGTLASAIRSGFILLILYWAYGFGVPTAAHPNPLEAPQAQLMAKLVEGATGGSLPWTLLALGAAIGLMCELCSISALAFSIGLYLPITNWPMILIGGLIAYMVTKHAGGAPEEEHDPGALYSSGLIAGDALTGIFIAGITVVGLDKFFMLRSLPADTNWFEALISTSLYTAIAVSLYIMGRKRRKKTPNTIAPAGI